MKNFSTIPTTETISQCTSSKQINELIKKYSGAGVFCIFHSHPEVIFHSKNKVKHKGKMKTTRDPERMISFTRPQNFDYKF